MGRELLRLLTKVGERVESIGIVEAFLIFPAAAFCFAVLSGRVGTNQFVLHAHVKVHLPEKVSDFAL